MYGPSSTDPVVTVYILSIPTGARMGLRPEAVQLHGRVYATRLFVEPFGKSGTAVQLHGLRTQVHPCKSR